MDQGRNNQQSNKLGACPALDLEHFLPYRLSLLTNLVSRAIAKDYAERFDLTIPEWRVMAVLGRYPGLSANQVADRSAMDKVTVSRAVARLMRGKRIVRKTDQADRRRTLLALSAEGQRIYQRIAPAAQKFQSDLIAGLEEGEIEHLDVLLTKLTERAQVLYHHEQPQGCR